MSNRLIQFEDKDSERKYNAQQDDYDQEKDEEKPKYIDVCYSILNYVSQAQLSNRNNLGSLECAVVDSIEPRNKRWSYSQIQGT